MLLGGSSSAAAAPATDLTLAASIELTGAAASIGQNWKNGAELGVQQANGKDGFTVAGKNYKWKLDAQDNKSTPDAAIAQYRTFVGDNDKFILGPGLSAAFLPAFNSLGSASALIMTPSSAALSAKPTADQSLFITTNTGVPATVTAVANAVIKKYSPKSVAILLPQDAAGTNYTTLYGNAFTAAGVKIVFNKSFPAGTTDYSSYITGMKAASPDMVLMGYLDSYLQPFLTQSIGAGFTSPVFVGSFGTDSAGLPTDASSIKNFSWPVSERAPDNASDPTMTQYRELYKTKYGSYPPPASFQAFAYYDPILALTKAMQDAGSVTDIPKITTALKALTTWPSQVMKERFDTPPGTSTYPHQIGISTNGTITYEDAGS